ncbi:MAG: hypothetical protein ACI90V_011767 [Bacillariaceae sp.]|jgi:hypothetical protein
MLSIINRKMVHQMQHSQQQKQKQKQQTVGSN